MNILKSQLKQLITEELNGLLKEIEDNFDGNTGEPLTDKGKQMCANNPACKEKWMKDKASPALVPTGHDASDRDPKHFKNDGSPRTRRGFVLCSGDEECWVEHIQKPLLKKMGGFQGRSDRASMSSLTEFETAIYKLGKVNRQRGREKWAKLATAKIEDGSLPLPSDQKDPIQ